MKISVHNANDEDAARLFSRNSPAGSGMVLPFKETLSAIDSNSSNSDRVNASVRQGFRVCEHLCHQALDGQGIRAFFETFKVPLLLPAFWFPRDPTRYAIRGHRVHPMTPYPKSVRNTTYYTLGDCETDVFDDWKVSKNTGDIGELEIEGLKGLRAALDLNWTEEHTLSTISRTTDFSHDLLEVPLPFKRARTPPLVRKRKQIESGKERTPDPADSSGQSEDDPEDQDDNTHVEENFAPRASTG